MVNAVTPTTSTPSTSTTSTTKTSVSDAAAASMNYDSFLKLFMAELQNQDPTSPMDTTTQMSQLASFSQVEQQIKMNTNLTSLLSQNMIGQAGSLIGKTVTDADGNTGVVSSIKVSNDSSTNTPTLIATLAAGGTMTIGNGVTVKATPTN